jgi:hypothetical protein
VGLNEVLKLDKWTGKCLVENKDVNYRLYIAEDVEKYIKPEELPDNIELVLGIPEL